MRKIMPGNKLEQKLSVAVITLVLLGTLATAACIRKSAAPPGELPAEAPLSAPLPLSGWTILVDPGHGGYDGGARARLSGTWEKELNLAVALATEQELIARGATVVLTRREDVDLCTDHRPAGKTMKREDMENRLAIARDSKADMILSIHMNQYRSASESGPQVFYRAGSDEGRLLAGCLQASLIAGLSPPKERSALSGDYFILGLDKPSALVECGFLSNAREEQLLRTADYRQRVAQAIAEGVAEFARLSR